MSPRICTRRDSLRLWAIAMRLAAISSRTADGVVQRLTGGVAMGYDCVDAYWTFTAAEVRLTAP
jgi:hypothetical protein